MSQGLAIQRGVAELRNKVVNGQGIMYETTSYTKKDGTVAQRVSAFPFTFDKKGATQFEKELNYGLERAAGEKPPRKAIKFAYTGRYRQPSKDERAAGVADVMVLTDIRPCDLPGNNLVIYGRVFCKGDGGVPEMKFFPSGGSQATFSVVVNTAELNPAAAKDAPPKEKYVEQATWYRVQCGGYLADKAADTVSSGQMIIVEGALQRREYTDKEGAPRASWELDAKHIFPIAVAREEHGEDRSGYDYSSAGSTDFAYGKNVAQPAEEDADWGNA